MKILSLNFGNHGGASSQYRVLQYIPWLEKHGIEVHPVPASEFHRRIPIETYDAVLIQKRLFSTIKLREIRRRARRLIYDTDDAIWHSHGKPHHWLTRWRTERRVRKVAKTSDVCTVANDVLGNYLARWNPNVIRIPMALDEGIWRQRPQTGAGTKLRVGWAGAPANLSFIEALEPALIDLKTDCEFVIFSGARPRFRQLEYQFIPFRQGEELAVMQTFDIGLLPLPATPFGDGKSPIKGLQYMATGLAVVLSPALAAQEMFEHKRTGLFARTLDEWVSCLKLLLSDPALRRELARNTRAQFESHYTLGSNAEKLAAVLSRSPRDEENARIANESKVHFNQADSSRSASARAL